MQCLLCVRPLLCYSKVLECAVFDLCQTIVVVLQQGARVCSVCSVSDHCYCVTARCRSVQCLLCVRPLLLCYSKVLECAVFALCQTIIIVLQQGAGVCSVCSVSDHCCCVTARCWSMQCLLCVRPLLLCYSKCRSVQCLLCVRPLLLCYSKVLECAVFALFQSIFAVLQQGAGVCSVCSVSDHCCCVTARCWSVQCLLCVRPLLCYSKVPECAGFALCQTIVVVLQQGAGVCSVCSVSDHCCVTTRCWSVQCLLCVRPLLLCYSKVLECAVFALFRTIFVVLQQGAGVCSVCSVSDHCCCVTARCWSVQCLLCVRPLLLCYIKVLECAVFALCQTIVVVLQQGAGVCSVCSV